jgi:hypothetical protein
MKYVIAAIVVVVIVYFMFYRNKKAVDTTNQRQSGDASTQVDNITAAPVQVELEQNSGGSRYLQSAELAAAAAYYMQNQQQQTTVADTEITAAPLNLQTIN